MAAKVIVITGANGGFGRALSQRFADDGETVIMLGRSLPKVAEVAAAIGPNAWPLECRISDPDSVRAAFAQIAARHPRIDVLINNAGNFSAFEIAEATDAQIMDGLGANLIGPILCARSAIPLMARGGQIINVTSESVEVNFAMLSIYQAGKAGLERFSRSLHEELADRGIRSIIFRAGQMYGPGMSGSIDPEIGARFSAANVRRGIDSSARGFTAYASAAQVMRNLVDLPQDVTVEIIYCQSVRPG